VLRVLPIETVGGLFYGLGKVGPAYRLPESITNGTSSENLWATVRIQTKSTFSDSPDFVLSKRAWSPVFRVGLYPLPGVEASAVDVLDPSLRSFVTKAVANGSAMDSARDASTGESIHFGAHLEVSS
jgi:hypothetical protein